MQRCLYTHDHLQDPHKLNFHAQTYTMRNLRRYVTEHRIRLDKSLRAMILCNIEICCLFNRYVEQIIVYKFETRKYGDGDTVYVFGSGRDLQVGRMGLLSGSHFLTGDSLYASIRDVQFIDLIYEKGVVSHIDAYTHIAIFKILVK